MLNLKFFLLVIAPFSCLALPNYGHVKARDLSCMVSRYLSFFANYAIILPTKVLVKGLLTIFLKKWANPGLFLFIFVIFSIQF